MLESVQAEVGRGHPGRRLKEAGDAENIGVSDRKTNNGENARMHETNTHAKLDAHDDMIKCNTQANDMAMIANNWQTPGASDPGRYTFDLGRRRQPSTAAPTLAAAST